jgi:hypothetical protein
MDRTAFVIIGVVILLTTCGCVQEQNKRPEVIEKGLDKEQIDNAMKLIQVDMITAMEATKPYECKQRHESEGGVVIWIWPEGKIRIWSGSQEKRLMDTIITNQMQMTKDKRYLGSVYDPKMFENCDWFLIEYENQGYTLDVKKDMKTVAKEFESAGYRCSQKELSEEDFQIGKNQVVCDITPELIRWERDR